ncbi:MAG: galactokinase, partial [Candidatus Binataceae bacterium]
PEQMVATLAAAARGEPPEIVRRARHVLTETKRVGEAVAALRAGNLERMGRLMNESHESLARDFQCSTARLDQMVGIARAAGAFGARLTGAGFGGSIVALCRRDRAPGVIDALDREYYARIGRATSLDESRAVLRAGAGAGVTRVADL